MNTLYFVKFYHKTASNQVVFLFTANSPEFAERKGFEHISEEYRGDYRIAEVTAICQTPDAVPCFEPC